MDERKGILLQIYKEYQLNDKAGNTKELQESQLFKHGREFLCSQFVKPRNRFLFLNIDFYKSILLKIATCENFDKQEGSALNRLMAGFHNLEKYAVNLWKFPWRKEYHSIKLYTAFFKYNVQEQLQDTDAILSILESLGYKKTPEEDQVKVKEPDFGRAVWVSLDLYLVQLDLLIIKEIMDTLADSKLSLRRFIRARSKTYDVNEACQFLSTDMAKRAKPEETQDSDTSSQKQLKSTPIGAINPTADVIHVAAYAVSSANSHSTNSILSTTAETTAMDTDETSTGAEGIRPASSADAYSISRVSAIHGHVPSNINPALLIGVPDRDLYGADTEENHLHGAKQGRFVASHDTSHQPRHLSNFDVTKRMADASMGSSHSLPYLGNRTSSSQGHQGFAHPNWRDQHGIPNHTQSGRVRPSTWNTADTRTVHPEITNSAEWQAQGSSGSDKYANIREIRDLTSQHFASKELFQSERRKETVIRQKDSTAVEDQRRLSATEPMEVDPHTASNRVDNFNSHSKRMTEGAYAKPEARSAVSEYSRVHSLSSRSNEFAGGAYARSNEFAGGAYATPKTQSGVSDLNNTLHHHLTLKNGTSKEAAVRSSSAREAHSSAVGTTKEEYLPGREVAGLSQSNRPPLLNVGAGYDTGTRTTNGRGSSLYTTSEATSSAAGATRVEYLPSQEDASASQSNRPPLPHVGAGYDTSTRTADGRGSSLYATSEASSSAVGATRVEYLPSREAARAFQSNRPPLPHDGAGYETNARTADGRGYSLYKREENGLSDDVRQHTRVSTGTGATRFLQDQGKSNGNLHEGKLKRDYYSERTGNDLVRGTEASSLKKDGQSSFGVGATTSLNSGDGASLCNHCMRQGELMCKNCLRIICKACEKIFETNLCERTKDKHVFEKLKFEGASKKSENLGDATYSNQQLFGPGDEEKEWPCSRCTYLNSPEYRICIICGATRGIGDVEQSKPGSTVCKHCTLHNEQDATVCKACGKTLDKSETFV